MRSSTRFARSRDGTLIAYALSGSGPPLVKTANWLTHLEFDGQSPGMEALARRTVAPSPLLRYDERGCGLSDREVEDLSFGTWVEDLEAVVEAADLERFTLFGMSQGGPVALAYAARHPEGSRAWCCTAATWSAGSTAARPTSGVAKKRS